jgi:uncharacterized protein YejL (UPF0352 family)
MPIDVAGSIFGLSYEAVVPVLATTDVITQVGLADTAVALGNRIEFIRKFVPGASDKPDRFYVARDDFSSGRYDAGDSAIYSDMTWKTAVTGAATASVGGGDAKHPGLLLQTILTSTTHAYFIGSSTANPLRFDHIVSSTWVMAVNEAGVNVASSFAVGYKEDANVVNGGTDALEVIYQPSSANWQIISRRASAQTTINTGVPVVFNEYIVVRVDKNTASNDLSVFINGALITTIVAASAPTGNCTFGGHAACSGADAFVLSAFTDFIEVVSNSHTTTASRAGA